MARPDGAVKVPKSFRVFGCSGGASSFLPIPHAYERFFACYPPPQRQLCGAARLPLMNEGRDLGVTALRSPGHSRTQQKKSQVDAPQIDSFVPRGVAEASILDGLFNNRLTLLRKKSRKTGGRF